LTTASRPALGPTQSPIQRVPGPLSLSVRHPGHEAHHSRPSSAEVKNAWSCTSTSSVRLHGVVLILKKHKFSFFSYNGTICIVNFRVSSTWLLKERNLKTEECNNRHLCSALGGGGGGYPKKKKRFDEIYDNGSKRIYILWLSLPFI
jgi:hypothetical protein